jgi:hypothetical protein
MNTLEESPRAILRFDHPRSEWRIIGPAPDRRFLLPRFKLLHQ